eukprot:10055812-Heterocapsa_arctica.AAC.1
MVEDTEHHEEKGQSHVHCEGPNTETKESMKNKEEEEQDFKQCKRPKINGEEDRVEHKYNLLAFMNKRKAEAKVLEATTTHKKSKAKTIP